jgi:hypothetical protein
LTWLTPRRGERPEFRSSEGQALIDDANAEITLIET